MSYQHLIVHREGPVEYLTLNRPDVRNAFNQEMVAELTAWAGRARDARDLRAVVLAGAGKVFCAGGDLKAMSETIRFTESENLSDAMAASKMFSEIDTLPVPLICRIHGAALGGGAGLASVCDIVVSDDRATFGFTEVKLGIIPAVISPFVLAKIGVSAARELFLTGTRFTVQRAKEIGLVHAIVPESLLDETVSKYVREMLTAGPQALAAAKALIRDVSKASSDVALLTASALAARRVSAEGQEGLKAFVEKRAPSWNS